MFAVILLYFDAALSSPLNRSFASLLCAVCDVGFRFTRCLFSLCLCLSLSLSLSFYLYLCVCASETIQAAAVGVSGVCVCVCVCVCRLCTVSVVRVPPVLTAPGTRWFWSATGLAFPRHRRFRTQRLLGVLLHVGCVRVQALHVHVGGGVNRTQPSGHGLELVPLSGQQPLVCHVL